VITRLHLDVFADWPDHGQMRRRAEAGFTLIEMLVTIALIGVLAAIAIPVFTDSKRKATSASEVNEFFAEFRVRQDQYALENGKYLETGANETSMFPAAPAAGGQALGLLPTAWKQLRIRPPETSEVRCAYVVLAGTNTPLTGTVGAKATAMGFSAPAKNWYYVLARCNADNDTAVDAYYMTTSESADIKKIDADK
jgi:prepilin-type N-terminal cleavage/methylation domain-containing protein